MRFIAGLDVAFNPCLVQLVELLKFWIDKMDNGGLAPKYPAGHTNPQVKAVIDLLTHWCQMVETGEVNNIFPDVAYQRKVSPDKPDWSEEEIEAILSSLDSYLNSQWLSWGKSWGYDDSFHFLDLDPIRRRALVQELDTLYASFPDGGGPVPQPWYNWMQQDVPPDTQPPPPASDYYWYDLE